MPALEAEGLTFRYAGRPALAVDDLSLSVPAGEVVGLLGPNGAGKTTTLSLLAGLLQPESGGVRIAGRDLARERSEALSALGLAPQEPALYPGLTPPETLRFFGSLHGLGGADLDRRVAEGLEATGLTARAGDPVRELSGGMKRRLSLAVALLHEPKVLLLDEPTVGVDPQSRRFLLDRIRGLAARGTAVLYSTHYMEEAEAVCDRVAIVDGGRLVASGTPADLVGRSGGPAPTPRFLEDLVALVARHGLPPESVTLRRPTLETVFLALTGRQLREES